MSDEINHFVCLNPAARAKPVDASCSHPDPSAVQNERNNRVALTNAVRHTLQPFHRAFARTRMHFPDKRLIQWDCGKLQELAKLLRKQFLAKNRCLIFTQMSKMLNILEAFLNIYGYRYLRLDGTTKTDERARMMEMFNNDESYFVFILSTRSGGVGMNLTGANVVIFYDIDWNPAMDLQAQDRAHRIGQTKEVHIYRLISQNTVEENIYRKSQQKKALNAAVIGDGEFTSEKLQTLDPRELLGLPALIEDAKTDGQGFKEPLPKQPQSAREIAQAMAAAEDEDDRVASAHLVDEQKRLRAEEISDFSDPSGGGSGNGISQKQLGDLSAQRYNAEMEAALSPLARFALNYHEHFSAFESAAQPLSVAGSSPSHSSSQQASNHGGRDEDEDSGGEYESGEESDEEGESSDGGESTDGAWRGEQDDDARSRTSRSSSRKRGRGSGRSPYVVRGRKSTSRSRSTNRALDFDLHTSEGAQMYEVETRRKRARR